MVVGQEQFEQTKCEKHAEVSRCAVTYVERRDERIDGSAAEAEAKVNLIEAMEAHGLNFYEDEDAGLIVRIKHGASVKVEKIEKGSNGEGGSDDD